MLFSEFPSEVVSRILRFADPSTIRRLQLVCRQLHTLIALDPFLQYILELDLSGYVLPSVIRTDLSHAEKIEALRDHRSKWEQTTALPSIFIEFLPAQRPTHRRCFVNGTFAYSVESGWTARSIYFYQLPSWNRGSKYRYWYHEDLGIDCDYFLIQPEWDLLVLLEKGQTMESPSPDLNNEPDFEYYQLHFRTMSTNKPHSAASCPFGPVTDMDFVGARRVTHMQIYGRLVLVVIATDRHESEIVWIVDWIAGVQVTASVSGIQVALTKQDISQSFERHSWKDYSASLLSERYFVTPRFDDPLGSPQLPGNKPNVTSSLEVHHIPTYNVDTQPLRACQLARFILPKLPAIENDNYVQLHSAEAPFSNQPSWPAQPQDAPRIFQSATQNLLALRIVASTAGILYICPEYLVAILDQTLGHTPIADLKEPLQIPWEAWGSATSWFNTPSHSCRPFESLSGLRASAIHWLPKSFSDSELELAILDFNSKRFAGQKRSILKDEGGTHLSSTNKYNYENLLEEAFVGGAVRAQSAHNRVKKGLKGSANIASLAAMMGDEHCGL